MILKEVQSGTIELVHNRSVLLLQFNCNCEDALPYCHAMCCRQRPVYNAKLDTDEIEKFKGVPSIGALSYIPVPSRDVLYVLPANLQTMDCSYLEDSKCTVHSDKPRSCKEWHCSPKGNINDTEIKHRDVGWMLMPVGAAQ